MTRFQTSLTAAVLTALMLAPALQSVAADSANQLSPAEKKAGWTLLFDGKTTKGWRNYRKDGIGDGWKVADGTLSRAARGAGDIVTAKQYDSFEMSLDYKISKGGNSGLMFHVTEEAGAPWHTGPEIQIQDNVDGHDPQKAGWLYQLYKANDDGTKPAGEWNTLHIRITPQQSVIYMNGLRYARFVKGSKDWDRRVAASKFSKYPNFGKPTKGHICLQDHGNPVSFRNIKIREIPAGGLAANPIDGTLPFKPALTFTNVKWTGWSPVSENGKPQPLRPIVLTHAGDGSNRVFVASQQGVIHAFDNHQKAQSTKIFLDISSKVAYSDKQNEEGLLGFAFHPKYKQNGEFFIYYTTNEKPQTSIISRFRVSKGNPDKADAGFEEEVMRIKQPYWNHNGGTIAFGPDGYLYVGLGDGGAGNDPHKNAQNLGVLLGSILRIDIDRKDSGKNYAIPADNPFLKKKGARGEIWALGLRNVWRLSFDRKTGALWVGDVGQNLWEEINIVTRGGNYGWNIREAAHTFGANGADAREDLIDPIWEYDHEVGKSITGGNVYRGKRLPELQGAYLYADYVSGKLWALKYDTAKSKVISNHAIPGNLQVISFGEDEMGEVYFTVVSPTGKGIYRLERAAK